MKVIFIILTLITISILFCKIQVKGNKYFFYQNKQNPTMVTETACFSVSNFDKVYKYITAQLTKSSSSFYVYEEFEIYLADDDICIKKGERSAIAVINKERGIFTLSIYKNKFMENNANRIFCALVEQLENN